MKRKDVINNLSNYLKAHNIEYESRIDIGCPEITMCLAAENAPSRCVESCIWFYEDGAEARAYYANPGPQICRESSNRVELLYLLNFINAGVFLACSDGADGAIYQPQMLYTPRIYLSEDLHYDIVMTTMIHYDFYELAPLETADYLTAYCPELLDKLSWPIFNLLSGQITLNLARQYIDGTFFRDTGQFREYCKKRLQSSDGASEAEPHEE